MENIKKEVLKSLSIGKCVEGYILVKSYQKVKAKSGNFYISGVVTSGVDSAFICWSSSSAFKVLADYPTEFIGKVVKISAEVIDFAGKPTLSIASIVPDETKSANDFIFRPYDKKGYQEAFLGFLKQSMTPEGYALYCKIMEVDTTEDSLWEQFSEEYAASSHHDNCPSGLLAHTFKMLGLLSYVIYTYSWVGKTDFSSEVAIKEPKEIDLLYLAVSLHDIGKVREMYNGVYQPNSYVTHRELGIEMLSPYRDKITELYGERGWYQIVSVILGHHDQYDDKARSVYAYIIHFIDNFEARFTSIGQELEKNLMENTTGKCIWYDEHRLYFS